MRVDDRGYDVIAGRINLIADSARIALDLAQQSGCTVNDDAHAFDNKDRCYQRQE
jgi:hypothetical protein